MFSQPPTLPPLFPHSPSLQGCGLPRRCAPRNDKGGGPCTRRHLPVFCMSLRTSAHTGVAIRIPPAHGVLRRNVLANAPTPPPSACHCEPVRTLVWQSASPLPMVSCAETSLQTHLRHRLLHVIANQCAHWCGNPFSPQRNLASWHYFWQIRSTFPYSPKVLLSVMPCRRRCGLPRRCAPRNDTGGGPCTR